jgi:hypothetical protein
MCKRFHHDARAGLSRQWRCSVSRTPRSAKHDLVKLMLTAPQTPLEERSQMAYPGNRRPLENKHLIRLPFGSIGPAGWLERKLQIEADGLARTLGF